MEAVISGQAGVALLVDGDELYSIHVRDVRAAIARRPSEFNYLFGSATDLTFVENVSPGQVRRELVTAADGQVITQLTLLLLAPDRPREIRETAASELSELLVENAVAANFAERLLFSTLLPADVDLRGALQWCEAARTREFLERLKYMQPFIQVVDEGWRAIPDNYFGTSEEDCRKKADAVFVREGVFRAFAIALEGKSSLDGVAFTSLQIPAVRSLTNHREILTQWKSNLAVESTSGSRVGKASRTNQAGKVLVVEGNAAWRNLLEKLIRRSCPSAEVRLAVNYEEANEALAGGTAWDLVVTDAVQSDSDGYGLGKSILRDARDKDLPVIVVSIADSVGARGAASAAQCGATYFSKWDLDRKKHVELAFVEQVRQVVTSRQIPKRARALNVFVSYSHKDETLCQLLEKHLVALKREGVINVWNDRRIGPGGEWRAEIDAHLNDASLILLLVSNYFLDSDYCYDVEMKCAMRRHDARLARVIPIVLRPCDWHGTPFSKLQALPNDGTPITSWQNRDEAFTEVARGVRQAAEEQRRECDRESQHGA